MNDHKFCFIACVNNDDYEVEMLRYIRALDIPEGYEIDFLSIHDARSMCAGYNEGMAATDAKYKIYLHQDVFITNRGFLHALLDIFRDETIGMMGLVGSPTLAPDCVMWHAKRVGAVGFSAYYRTDINGQGPITPDVKNSSSGEIPVQTVEAVDGFLIATQVDLKWREDLFKNFDFYDISQSTEMRLAGYRVVVPAQDEPWCMHDDAFTHLDNYEKNRRIFVQTYPHRDGSGPADVRGTEAYSYAMEDERQQWSENYGGEKLVARTELVNDLIRECSLDSLAKLSSHIHDKDWFTPMTEQDEYAALFLAVTVYDEEVNKGVANHIFTQFTDIMQVKQGMFVLRMLLFRISYQWDFLTEQGREELISDLMTMWEKYPSIDFIWRGLATMTPRPRYVARRLQEIFESRGLARESMQMLLFMDITWPGNARVNLQLADILSQDSPEAAGEYLSRIPTEFWSMAPEVQMQVLVSNEAEWMD